MELYVQKGKKFSVLARKIGCSPATCCVLFKVLLFSRSAFVRSHVGVQWKVEWRSCVSVT